MQHWKALGGYTTPTHVVLTIQLHLLLKFWRKSLIHSRLVYLTQCPRASPATASRWERQDGCQIWQCLETPQLSWPSQSRGWHPMDGVEEIERGMVIKWVWQITWLYFIGKWERGVRANYSGMRRQMDSYRWLGVLSNSISFGSQNSLFGH